MEQNFPNLGHLAALGGVRRKHCHILQHRLHYTLFEQQFR